MKSKCLLVDDIEANLIALEGILEHEAVEIFKATSGTIALDLLLKHEFAFALIDVQMPEMSGFELAEFMRGSERTRTIPIIFLTANNDERLQFQGYESGAVDLLYKPLDEKILISKVRIFLELEEKRKTLQEQLIKIQREQQLREKFISTLAHDLRTPLANTKLLSQITVKNNLDKPEMVKSAFSKIIENVERVDGMISNMLDAHRISAGKPLPLKIETFDLSLMLSKVLDDLEIIYGKKIIRKIAPLINVHSSFEAIRRILENLISNAMKYGEVEKGVTVSLSAGPEMFEICVHNWGKPISKEDQEILFLQYERLEGAEKSGSKGWGLGLTLVQGLVQGLGGTITVSSSQKEGTTFKVRIPVRTQTS